MLRRQKQHQAVLASLSLVLTKVIHLYSQRLPVLFVAGNTARVHESSRRYTTSRALTHGFTREMLPTKGTEQLIHTFFHPLALPPSPPPPANRILLTVSAPTPGRNDASRNLQNVSANPSRLRRRQTSARTRALLCLPSSVKQRCTLRVVPHDEVCVLLLRRSDIARNALICRVRSQQEQDPTRRL